GRADLDPAGARADGREERERRAELAGEVMHAEIGAVGAQLLGGHGQFDRLEQRVRRGTHLRGGRRSPVPERQESDPLHRHILSLESSVADKMMWTAEKIGRLDSVASWSDIRRYEERRSLGIEELSERVLWLLDEKAGHCVREVLHCAELIAASDLTALE